MRFLRMTFYDGELWELFKTMAVLGVALAFSMQGGVFRMFQQEASIGDHLQLIAVIMLTLGVSVVLHEVLGHKFAAQHFGFAGAHYQPNNPMLWLSLIFGALGSSIIFLNPGHVLTPGYTTTSESGKIKHILEHSGAIEVTGGGAEAHHA